MKCNSIIHYFVSICKILQEKNIFLYSKKHNIGAILKVLIRTFYEVRDSIMNNIKASYSGVIDEAARFVEKIQLLDKSLWDKVVAVFDYGKYKKHWHGEYWGKLMRGGCIVYKYTKSEELYDMLTYATKELLKTQDEKGRISTYDEEYELYDWDIWCRKYVMYGLMYYMEICRDESFKKKILSALTKHADYMVERIGEGKIDITKTSGYWLSANSSSILRPYVLLYKMTGEKRYLDFAEYIISTGGIDGGNLIELAYEDKLAPFEYPEAKAYETTSVFEGVFEYATLTKNERLIETCIKYADKVLKTDFTIIGASGCYDELFDNSTKKQVTYTESHMQETCVTVTVMEYMCRMLEYTGDAKYADAIERSFYNAFLGAINRKYGENDGLHFDSYSPILNNRRGLCVGGKMTLLDGSYYGCCAAIGAAGFGAVTSMSAICQKSNLKISFYEKGTIKFSRYNISVNTEYPFDGKITLVLNGEGEDFSLSLRIPEWCKKYSVALNEDLISGRLDMGFLTLEKTVKSGDKIVLDLDMPFVVQTSECFDPNVKNYFAVTKGPIVFATEDYENNTFDMNKISEYGYEGIQSRASLLDINNNSVRLYNYASVGIDWSKKMTVWLKR